MTRDELLAAVCGAPDDDAPRLAYADWLLANGDAEQAAFIRAQCSAPNDPDGAGAAEWGQAILPGAYDIDFHRGLPVAAAVPIAGAAPDPLVFLDRAPIQRLRPILITDVEAWAAADADTRAELADEDLPTEPHRSGVAARIAADPRAARLRGLDLSWQQWGEAPLRALLAGPHWDGLEELYLGDADSQVFAAEVVAAAPSLRGLHTLQFRGDYGARLGDAGVEALAAGRGLASLRRLALLNVELGPAGARALATSTVLTGLTELDLGWGSYNGNRVGPDGAAALAESANLAALTNLVLDFNHIGDDGLAALAHSQRLARLDLLAVKSNEVGDPGIIALSNGGGLPRLSVLELTFNKAITSAGVAALAGSPRLATLRTLWLRQCPAIGSDGAAALARSPHAANLTDLNLLECGIGPDGAIALADSPHLTGLTRLQLKRNPLDEASRQRLLDRFGDRVEV